MADLIAEDGFAQAIVETITQPLLVLGGDLRVRGANPAFLEQFRVTRDETLGRAVYDLGNGQWQIPELRRLLEEVLTRDNYVEDYRVEHAFDTIGQRVMLLNASCMRREGKADLILLAISDITEHERLHFELEGRKEFAEKLIDSVREALLVLDRNLFVHSANQSFYDCFGVTSAETIGRPVYGLGNGQWDIPELRRLLEDILPKQSSFDDYEVEHDFESLGRRAMLLNARRLDHLNLILVAIRDVTEQRRSETRQKALMGELQHRVKNILSNVQALANQTRRGSRTLEEFSAAFEARLGALARAQDLLVRNPSEAIALDEVVRRELDAVGAEERKNFTVEGPSVRLAPRKAQALAMIVHELTTNAAKYGALNIEGARIEITWTVLPRDERDHLSFLWREHGVAITDTNPPKGFGSRIIEQSLSHMLGGTAERRFHPDGASCRLEFPLSG